MFHSCNPKTDRQMLHLLTQNCGFLQSPTLPMNWKSWKLDLGWTFLLGSFHSFGFGFDVTALLVWDREEQQKEETNAQVANKWWGQCLIASNSSIIFRKAHCATPAICTLYKHLYWANNTNAQTWRESNTAVCSDISYGSFVLCKSLSVKQFATWEACRTLLICHFISICLGLFTDWRVPVHRTYTSSCRVLLSVIPHPPNS